MRNTTSLAGLHAALAAISLLLPLAAWSHDGAAGQDALHGGRVALVDCTAYELVQQGGRLNLYVHEHGQPVDLGDIRSEVEVAAGGIRHKVAMQALGQGRYASAAAVTLPPQADLQVVLYKATGEKLMNVVY